MSLDKCPQKWREVGSGQMSKHVAISKGFWCEGVVNRSLVRLTLVILINPKNGGNMHTLDVHADVHAGVHLWCAFPIGRSLATQIRASCAVCLYIAVVQVSSTFVINCQLC